MGCARTVTCSGSLCSHSCVTCTGSLCSACPCITFRIAAALTTHPGAASRDLSQACLSYNLESQAVYVMR